jgi:type II secretory pathway component PulF
VSTRYRYRAATAAGEIREGVLQAASREGVIRELRGQQLTPVEIVVGGRTKAARASSRGRHAAVTLWTRELATLLEAGFSLDRALAVTIRHASHDGLKEALETVRREVRGGLPFSDALERNPRYFPSLVPALVRAGEATGALTTVMEEVADHLEESGALRSEVRSALLYPALMAAVATLGVLVLLVFVIPRFATILEDVGGTLPWTTRVLSGGSRLLATWWWLGLAVAAAGVLWARRSLADPATRERWDAWRLTLPWTGELEQKYVAARFARTLGLLLHSGVAIVTALRMAADTVGNRAARHQVARAADQVAEGGTVSAALDGTLPDMAITMLAVGEESGRLEELCIRVAAIYDREVRRTMRSLVAMLEPALILIFGGLVGFVAVAMLQAIYSINTGVF